MRLGKFFRHLVFGHFEKTGFVEGSAATWLSDAVVLRENFVFFWKRAPCSSTFVFWQPAAIFF
jgi:hypothetical protein